MSQEQKHISKKRVLYQIPGMDAVTVERNVEYGVTEAGTLVMDVYYPPGMSAAARCPLVVIVAGYSDVGFQKAVGCKFKDMGSSVSWCQLIAASGVAAVAYTNQEPAADLRTLLRYLCTHASALRLDETRVGLWASSGNAPLALSALMDGDVSGLSCAGLCYGFMLDLDGATGVADAAGKFGFKNPGAGRSVSDFPQGLPLFIARAGHDEFPGLNASIDSFVARALALNLPITVTNHPAAPHAFDLMHDSKTSRDIIGQMLTFFRSHLLHT